MILALWFILASDIKKTLRTYKKYIFILLTIVITISIAYKNELGIDISRNFIINKLGGVYETNHFIIYYEKGSEIEKEIELIAKEHEFRFTQVTNFLKVSPKKKVKSFYYTNPSQKKKFMGAKHTMIGNPINFELHIHHLNFPHPILKHELTHVLSSQFGNRFIKMSLKIGLTEGLAVATEWDKVQDFTPHQVSSGLVKLEMLPEIENLMKITGFWKESSLKSYTVSGSFCRYLIDNYGIEKFKILYSSGNFFKTYNLTLNDLVEEWKTYLKSFNLSQEELNKIKEIFSKPSIFQKVCAHEIAFLKEKASFSFQEGDYFTATNLYKKIYNYTENKEFLFLLLKSIYFQGEITEAKNVAYEILNNDNLNLGLKIKTKLFLAKIYIKERRIEEGITLLKEIYNLNFSPNINLEVLVYLEILSHSIYINNSIIELITEDINLNEKIEILNKIILEDSFYIFKYLLGKSFYENKEYKKASFLLEEVILENMPFIIKKDAYNLLGIIYFYLMNYEKSINSFKNALQFLDNELENDEILDWIERVNFYSICKDYVR